MSVSRTARIKYLDGRKIELDPKDPLAPELFNIDISESKGFDRKSFKYLEKLWDTVVRSQRPGDPVPDIKLFKAYMTTKFDIKSILPRGVPLCVSLLHDAHVSNTWLYPDMPYYNQIQRSDVRGAVIEIQESQFDHQHFNREKLLFMKSLPAIRDNILSSNSLPFSILRIQMDQSEYDKLIRQKESGGTIEIIANKSDLERESLIYVPTGLLISNGASRYLYFNFGFKDISKPNDGLKRTLAFKFDGISEEILRFWSELPLLFSVSADIQMIYFRNFLTDVYDLPRFDLKTFDLGSLAIVAGCNMDSYCIFALSTAVRGISFPENIGGMDQRNVLFCTDPDVLNYHTQQSILLYEIYISLVGLIIRNLFPDPDITLAVTEMSQRTFITWFSEFLGLALQDCGPTLKFIRKLIGTSHTREEMVRSLDSNSVKIDQLASLFHNYNVPVAQCGGERYLHNARGNFIFQYGVLRKIYLPQFAGEIPNPHKNMDDEQYGLLFNRDYYIKDSGKPASDLGLLPSPQFARNVYNLDLDHSDLIHFMPQNGRSLAVSLEEWGRLNPTKIPTLFSKLRKMSTDDLAKFWAPRVRVYESLRGMYYRLFDVKDGVPDLDMLITSRIENTRSHHYKLEESRELKLQQHRVNLLRHESGYAPSTRRVGMHQYVQNSVPGSNNQRNRRLLEKRKARLARREDEHDPEDWVPKKDIKRQKLANILNTENRNPQHPQRSRNDNSSSRYQESRAQSDRPRHQGRGSRYYHRDTSPQQGGSRHQRRQSDDRRDCDLRNKLNQY